MADADRCVCCGEIVPEGRQACPQCERKKYVYTIPDIPPSLNKFAAVFLFFICYPLTQIFERLSTYSVRLSSVDDDICEI